MRTGDSPVLHVPFVSAKEVSAKQIARLMEENGVEWNRIGHTDWPEEYPYAPIVHFRLAYGEEALLVEYRVTENDTQAVADKDNGRVWEDSCVEMFLSPYPDSDIYYNLEANCLGTVLFANRGGGRDAEHAPEEILKAIERHSSIAQHAPLARMEGKQTWTLSLKVPYSAFWKDTQQFPPRMAMRANFYKCGDKMARPHFLSWSPIYTPKPNFHLPQFFGHIVWER